MDYVLLLAGGASAFALVTHVMLGARHPLLPPLDADETRSNLSRDAWLGRHLLTTLLLAMTIVFIDASRRPAAHDVALWLSLVAAVATALGLAQSAQAAAPRMALRNWGATGISAALGIFGALN